MLLYVCKISRWWSVHYQTKINHMVLHGLTHKHNAFNWKSSLIKMKGIPQVFLKIGLFFGLWNMWCLDKQIFICLVMIYVKLNIQKITTDCFWTIEWLVAFSLARTKLSTESQAPVQKAGSALWTQRVLKDLKIIC